MITLGIFGSMGSGKTYVCRILSVLYGIPIFNCDLGVKRILNQGDGIIMGKLIELCGVECYTRDNKWVPTHIAKLAETDKAMLDKISHIIKPYLLDAIKLFKEVHKDAPYCAIESALFGRSEELRNTVDKMIVVTAPLEQRIKRIKERDPQRSDNEIILLLYNQLAPNIHFDYIIYNGDKEEVDVENQIGEIFGK